MPSAVIILLIIVSCWQCVGHVKVVSVPEGSVREVDIRWEGTTLGRDEITINDNWECGVQGTLEPGNWRLPLDTDYVTRDPDTPWKVYIANENSSAHCTNPTATLTENIKRRVLTTTLPNTPNMFKISFTVEGPPVSIAVEPTPTSGCLAAPIRFERENGSREVQFLCPPSTTTLLCFALYGEDQGDFLNDIPCVNVTESRCKETCGENSICSVEVVSKKTVCSCDATFLCTGQCDSPFSRKKCSPTCTAMECPSGFAKKQTQPEYCESHSEKCAVSDCCTSASHTDGGSTMSLPTWGLIILAVVPFSGCFAVTAYLVKRVRDDQQEETRGESPPLREPLIAMEMTQKHECSEDLEATVTSTSTEIETHYPAGSDTPTSEHLASSMKSASGHLKKTVSIHVSHSNAGSSWRGSPHSSARSTQSGNHLTVHKDSFRKIPRVTSTHVPRGAGRPPQHPSTCITSLAAQHEESLGKRV